MEERITIWSADSFDEAIEQAEREAKEYAGDLNLCYLRVGPGVQAFAGARRWGFEMFSLMRESDLSDEAYLTTFFGTGTERQHHAQ